MNGQIQRPQPPAAQGQSTPAGRMDPRALYADLDAAAAQAQASGLPVVGVVGHTVPVELIRAAGCFPLTLTGRHGPTPAGDRWMEPFFDPEIRAVFDGLLRGRFGPLALCVIPRTSDQHFKLFLYLAEVARIGQGQALPPLHLYDLLHTRSERSRRYGLERSRELLARLEQLAGYRIGPTELHAAIDESNRANAARGQVLACRDTVPASLDGTTALALLGASRLMLPSQYVDAVQAVLQAPRTACAGPRILLKGFPLNHDLLHRAIEEAGGVVVAEDDAWGSRACAPPIDNQGDPLEAIFDHYFRHVPSARVHPDSLRRQWYTARLAAGGIDGVVLYAPPFDDLIGWDIPDDLAVARELGIPATVLRQDAELPGSWREGQIATFVRGLVHD
jgi:benzoyl-CoA reductase/2-hydroxyglutaryl-CoA dehydratase subunit BcrC/BadD/HgdB